MDKTPNTAREGGQERRPETTENGEKRGEKRELPTGQQPAKIVVVNRQE
jgi:hypothetical protein